MSLKFYPRLNLYKNYNGTNIYNPKKDEAVSYHWWVYYKNFDGYRVFNTYFYSPTTSKHQSQLKGLRPVDLFIEAPGGLQDLAGAVQHYNGLIIELESLINKKGTRKKKNIERKELIKEYQYKQKMIQKIITKGGTDV